MATSFEHRALVEQLRSLTSKRAENPGEQILTTDHPSGSNEAADDHTQPAVTGARYAENSKMNKKQNIKGTESSEDNQSGAQEKMPENNKGLHPRATGVNPVDYSLGDHHDPGSTHPSAKSAAQELAKEAKSIAAILRGAIKSSGMSAPAPTSAPVADPSQKQAEELAHLRVSAIKDMRQLQNTLKESAVKDAGSFVQTISSVIQNFTDPHVMPAIHQANGIKAAAAADAEITDATIKIAMFDRLAAIDGAPSFVETLTGITPGNIVKKAKYKKPLKQAVNEDEAIEEEMVEGEEEAAEGEAEEVLADMAANPAAAPAAGGQAPLSPEDEAALVALLQQEGMKESDVKAYAKIAASIVSGRIDPRKMSQAQIAFVSTCDGAVKRAGAKFQTLRSASRLHGELNTIYRGIS